MASVTDSEFSPQRFESVEDIDGVGNADPEKSPIENAFHRSVRLKTQKYVGATAVFPCDLATFTVAFLGEVPDVDHTQNNGGEHVDGNLDDPTPSRLMGPPLVMGIEELNRIHGDIDIVAEGWQELVPECAMSDEDASSRDADLEEVSNDATECLGSQPRQFQRVFRFRTPIVGSPIGPTSTRAVKTQVFLAI
jgi:hypothetical protein